MKLMVLIGILMGFIVLCIIGYFVLVLLNQSYYIWSLFLVFICALLINNILKII